MQFVVLCIQEWICDHIYWCVANFLRQNLLISIGIHTIWNFNEGERFPHRLHSGFNWVMWICRVDQQKAVWFQSDFDMSCASYSDHTLTIDNGPFHPQNFAKISLIWKKNNMIMIILENKTSCAFLLMPLICFIATVFQNSPCDLTLLCVNFLF